MKPLEKEDIKELLHRAVTDEERGMGTYRAQIDEDALEFLAERGKWRRQAALNAIELGIIATERSADGIIHIDLPVAQECIQKRAVRYDKSGDSHYDTYRRLSKA